MKTRLDFLFATLPQKILLVLAVMITLAIALDSALHASHIMVFFALIILSVLFLSLYAQSERHKLGVSIASLVLGSIYLMLYSIDFSWWRFTMYTGTLYFLAALFFTSWLITRQPHHRHEKKISRHGNIFACI